MDKMKEEFQKWYNRRFANGSPDPEVIQHGQEDMFESYQAATAEAEKYREALQKIAEEDVVIGTGQVISYHTGEECMDIAKQALQKD
jgi:hypothetical protein